MKWIRRKPSGRVRNYVAFVCLIYLVALPKSIGAFWPGYGSTKSDWHTKIRLVGDGWRAPPIRGKSELVHEVYRVIERDDAFIIASEHDENYLSFAVDRESFPITYFAGYYQSGFWAPTRWHDAKALVDPASGYRKWAGPNTPLNSYNVQRRRVELIAEWGFDPRLIGDRVIADGHIIWTGYFANALSLIALLLLGWWLFWSLVWVATMFQECKQRRRQALGLCPMCAYDLKGTPGRCSECGWGQAGEAGELNEASG